MTLLPRWRPESSAAKMATGCAGNTPEPNTNFTNINEKPDAIKMLDVIDTIKKKGCVQDQIFWKRNLFSLFALSCLPNWLRHGGAKEIAVW